jgi:hypothetical protein
MMQPSVADPRAMPCAEGNVKFNTDKEQAPGGPREEVIRQWGSVKLAPSGFGSISIETTTCDTYRRMYKTKRRAATSTSEDTGLVDRAW